MQRSLRSILIADPNPGFLKTLGDEAAGARIPAILVNTGKEAQLAIADTGRTYAGVFVNPQLENPAGISVVRFVHQRRPSLPVYLIHNEGTQYTKEELRHMGVQRAIPKPFKYTELAELVGSQVVMFDSNPVLELAKKNKDALDSEVSAEDAGFVPTPAVDFVSGAVSFFDLYVRLSSGRYIKILQGGDTFSPDRLETYLKKGVTQFYLRKEAQEHYVAFCDKIATAAIKSAKISTEIKVSRTLAHGQETMSFLKTQGLSEANLQHAESYIENTRILTQQLKLDKNEAIKGFLDNLAGCEHGVSVAMVASLVVPHLGFQAEKTVKIVGLACMFHDIGLGKLAPEIQNELDEKKFTDEQRSLFRQHPGLGAQMLRGVEGIEESVIQAVAKHHERRGKKGFPPREVGASPNKVAEIVGICDELVNLVSKHKLDPKINVRREMEFDVFNGFSYPVCAALKAAIFPLDK